VDATDYRVSKGDGRPRTGHIAPQVVVVCGGSGTRIAPSIGNLPKVLTPIGGRPLLSLFLEDLRASFPRAEVLLLAGHGGDRVAAAAAELAPAGIRVEVLVEPRPLGTAGALHAAADHLRERFLFACGDIVTALDWHRFWEHAQARGGLGTLLVHRSSHPEDSDLVALGDDDRAIAWSRRGARRGTVGHGALGNAGLAVLHRDILRGIPPDRPTDLFRDILPSLVTRRAAIHGYRTSEYVKDMGTPDRLEAVREDARRGRIERRADLVLLDRDGVLNEDVPWLSRPEDLRLIPGSARGVRRLNEAGILTAVVTNQPVIARGMCSAEEMDRIHDRLRGLLAAEGATLDRVYVCPHHPETHHGEGIAALRGPCPCRKPATGMVEQALSDLDAPAWRSLVVGDRTSDMQLAANAGLASIGVETGQGLGDGLCPAPPVWTFPDLGAACDWICGPESGS
ncbi:MAG: HAD-IIIA family hydrolase, partial [Acidobacteriota bacterium]